MLVMRQEEISGSVSVTYSASMQAGAIYVMALQPGVSDETRQDRGKVPQENHLCSSEGFELPEREASDDPQGCQAQQHLGQLCWRD